MLDKKSRKIKKFYQRWLPAFQVINQKMRQDYRAAIPLLLQRVAINDSTRVLDVGTGTGALAGILSEYSSRVTGIDFSPEMLNEARKVYGDKIEFREMAAHEISCFEPGSFDMVVSAYCLHDMNDSHRLFVLEQMRRAAGQKVVIFDLARTLNPVIWAIELLEGSFYRDYIKAIDRQVAAVFPWCEKIAFSNWMCIYICDV
ncbi:class I SAM-dependent methyltransferase [Phosphitispora fastidiosa]|uniref:class I SAM-dependent methyltransferase n=1 Tax=Phosphitispora fastidiosa TaxID=2837202 RepID=UPI001E37DBDE|nr:class I SAM-dependent methyltransferase [Phosphitispora fastidiosa]MBU7005710.1 ubiquinone/menaquinone biosynthesis C-methylase UbiE [Phosphitispora fastidiosa]